VEALVDGAELVLAVVAFGADDEREVDLGRRRRAGDRSASASPTNSAGRSASARVAGSRPMPSRARAASSRDATPASASEFASVLRRWANAPSTTLFTCGATPGAVRRNATSAESTFGRGRNTSRDTAWKPVRSAASCTSTDTAPYAFVRGAAKK